MCSKDKIVFILDELLYGEWDEIANFFFFFLELN